MVFVGTSVLVMFFHEKDLEKKKKRKVMNRTAWVRKKEQSCMPARRMGLVKENHIYKGFVHTLSLKNNLHVSGELVAQYQALCLILPAGILETVAKILHSVWQTSD